MYGIIQLDKNPEEFILYDVTGIYIIHKGTNEKKTFITIHQLSNHSNFEGRI